MELRQLKYFLTIAESRSLTAAAKSLHVTQPTLTMAMKKLELELSTTLFHHSAQGHRLTETGRMLYDEGGPLLAALTDLTDRIRGWDDTHKETVRIGLTVLFSMQHLQSITTYMTSHRQVEVTFVQGGSREMQRRLAAGDVDLGIVSFPQWEPDIVLEPLPGQYGSYDVACVLPEDHPLAGRERLSLADLRGERWSSFSDDFVLGFLLRERAATAGHPLDIAFVNDDWQVLLASVQELKTVCLMPAPLKALDHRAGLAWVPLDDKASRLLVGLATRRDATHSSAVEGLIAALRSTP